MKAFAKDRAKRILLPLVLGLPVVMLLVGAGVMLGGLPHGVEYLQSLTPRPPARAGGIDLAHLWFLYYLLMFYVLALVCRALDARGALATMADRVVSLLMRGPWGPMLLAVPAAAYYWRYQPWAEWMGLPAPSSLRPDIGGLIGYGVPFALGWLLHRRIPTLLNLQKSWLLYLVLATALTIICVSIVGSAPHWHGPKLQGQERVIYTSAYMVGTWCWVFAFIGGAIRFCRSRTPSFDISPMRRTGSTSCTWCRSCSF